MTKRVAKRLLESLIFLCVVNAPLMAEENMSKGQASESGQESCRDSYEFKVKTRTEFNFQGRAITRHELSGYLSLRKLLPSRSMETPGQWWGLQLTDLKQKANGENAAVENIYYIPFAVLRANDGLLREFYFPGDWSKEQTDRLKGFAYYLQFADKTTFRNEQDTIGDFSANYQVSQPATANRTVKAGSSKTEIIKQKRAYLNAGNVSHQKNLPPSHEKQSGGQVFDQIEVLSSEQRFDITDCWFDSTRGEEDLKVVGLGQSYQMLTSQKYSVLSSPSLRPADLWTLAENHRLWRLDQKTIELSESELKQLRLELAQTLQAMNILELSGRELAALLKKYDAAIAVVYDLMLEGQLNDDEFKRMFNALGHVDSPASNKLLMDAISEASLSEENRFRAMRAITQGISPLTQELNEQMLDLLYSQDFSGSESLRGAAVMALGAVVQRRDGNEYSDSLLYALAGQMTPDINTNERAALAASLGNTSDPRVLDTLAKFSSDAHDRVRSNVATSIGQLAVPEGKNILKQMIANEPDNKPKQAAVHALRHFKLSATELESVEQVALTSNSERTRGYAIQTLGAQSDHPEQVKAALKRLMKTEPSKRNFVQAAKILTQINKPDTN